ncbi:MAG: c-type cytochrome biogenesis protein CcmI [Gammaproteobacteria bacterium]|nr:c-type cytochrome biogenesis protein CcmI [Gammaproteobacteria bacterium]
MILFWLLALLLVAVALAFVLPPLLATTRHTADDDDDERARLEVYRSRRAALEEQHRSGALSQADLGEARDELARELLEDTTPRGARRRRPAPRGAARTWLAIAVGVGVPLLAIALYQRLGTPQAVDGDSAPASMRAAERSVEAMVAGLAARLESQPDDSDGWLLLARSYMALDRYADAYAAFSSAHRLLGDSPQLLADMAEASALANRQDFLGVPSGLLERALELDPHHPKALWLGAFAARQRGEASLAASRWQALLDRQPPDSEAAELLRGLIADSGAGAERATPAAGAPALGVEVTLDERLAAGLDGSEVLYVFARAADGPAMPLAVARATAGDLPLSVTLDDSMAMAAGGKLSDAERVVVGARIALGGTPTASSGDLQGFSQPVSPRTADTVRVLIDQRVP